jgi:predicted anti-sigma-YlaC factor YlaD
MSIHVSEWLNAYHDGELRGNRLRSVETHLSECELCQAELESLETLSEWLQEVHAPETISAERFSAQVNLRLPHSRRLISEKKVIEFGWWMIPVGLLASWVFVNTAFVISDILTAANGFGLLSGISNWLALGAPNDIYLSTTIGQAGLLSGNGLSWAETVETITRVSLPQIILQISIALLYLSWMAIWWARHTRQGLGQLLEG